MWQRLYPLFLLNASLSAARMCFEELLAYASMLVLTGLLSLLMCLGDALELVTLARRVWTPDGTAH